MSMLKYIQLNNGIELVSKIDSTTWETSIDLSAPFELYTLPTKSMNRGLHTQTLILVKWLPWVSEPITINTDNILVICDVTEEMEKYYTSTLNQLVNTKIEEEFEKFDASVDYSDTEDSVYDFIEDMEEESPKDLKELTDMLNEIAKNKRKLH